MTHVATVSFVTNNHGYPYRATCECGWKSWGYVAEHAAQGMADDHVTLAPYRDATRNYFAQEATR